MEKTIKPVQVFMAIILLIIGCYSISYLPIKVLKFSSLAVTGFIAYYVLFGKEGIKNLFSKPTKPIKYVLLFLIANLIYSVVSGIILTLLGLHLKENPLGNDVNIFFYLPIALIGEELFSITIFDLLRTKISLLPANLISGLIFGLIHFSTYYNGTIVQTLAHILLIQGFARIIFNSAYVKSKSIYVPWIVHVLFDAISFGIGIILSH